MTEHTMNGGADPVETPDGQSGERWSARVRSRREAMLPFLQDAVIHEKGRRQRRRLAARGAITLVLMLAVSIPIFTHRSSPGPRIANGPGSVEPGKPSPFRLVSILQSQPRAFERLALTTNVDSSIYTVDDRELVRTLAAIGRPTGLIRSTSGIRLTDPVTDLELRPTDAESNDSPRSPTNR